MPTTPQTAEPPAETLCWKCSKSYPATFDQCQHCCATNANVDLESAQAEMADASKISHEWEFQDDSFDHAFGTERVHYFRCGICNETRGMEPGDYCDDYEY
jgi:hypothetical protein